jgi:glycosyltransferase involved in cell wall biosynthesis
MPEQGRPVFALEVSPLGERHYTGIANVTRMLAKEMLDDPEIEAKFVMGRSEIPPALIEKLLGLGGGDILWWLAGRLDSRPRFAGDFDRPIVGLYPSTKPYRRLFPFEALILHDLTTVVTPQFHTEEAVGFWQQHLLPDMLSSELLIAVSQSTASDIRTYFPQVDHIPCLVVPEASCCGEVPPLPKGTKVVDYVLVLGTLEPRKNVEIVFEMLMLHPDLLATTKFVFVGRWGWGAETASLIAAFHLEAHLASKAIEFTGFISDGARDQLLANAAAVIYPSVYEGFGLPIIEAMAYGTPIVTTYATSLPEVGGDLAEYFDQDSVDSLYAVVGALLNRVQSGKDEAQRKARLARARDFTWKATYRRIRDGALELAAAEA